MADEQAARRYAQAVFGIAKDSDTFATWRTDLEDIAGLFVDSDAAGLFADNRVPVAKRQAYAERALDVQPQALNLARLLIKKGRSSDARALAVIFETLADEHEGIAFARVTTAVPIDDRQLGSIEGRLGQAMGKKVRASAAVDPDILGGIVIRIGDRLIDGSVRTKLQSLRRELKGSR